MFDGDGTNAANKNPGYSEKFSAAFGKLGTVPIFA